MTNSFIGEQRFQMTGQMKLLQHSLCPPKPQFAPDQLPDLSGRVMLVTGGNTGIGKEIIKELLIHNAKVYMASRSRDRAMAAIEQLKQETGKEAHFVQLDLTSLASVRKAAEDFLSKEQELHTLFNNAGVMWSPIADVTADGYDMQFGTNVVGHFLLTKLLLPALLKGKETSPDKHARIVTTSSGYAYVGHIKFDTLKDTPERKKVSTETQYNQSKLADVLVSNELARRYGDQGIVSVSLHPGILKTELTRHMPWLQRKAMDSILHPAPMGAITPLYAGASTEGVELNGKFLIPWARVQDCPNPEAYDEDLARRVYEWLEKEVSQH